MRRVALCAVLVLSAAPSAAREFTWSFQADAQSLDPYALNETFTTGFLGNVYEPLVRRDPDLVIEPALAESWEMLSDTVWRFKLRADVHFHDGTPLTADDVVFSIERAKHEASDLKARVTAIASAEAIDDHTVEIRTAGPDPVLLANLTNVYIMNRDWALAHGAEAPVDVRAGTSNHAQNHANGTGPFLITERRQDEATVFEVNADWWDEPRHNLGRVVFRPLASDATRLAALMAGDVDMMYPLPVQNIAQVEAAAEVLALTGPELRTILLGMDQASDELRYSNVAGANPLKDRRVREALYRAIDERAIIQRIMRGHATPAALLNGPGINGFDAALNARLGHDVERARDLLAEAGYADGFALGMQCPNDRYVNDEAICQAIVSMLAQIGVDVTLDAMPKTRYFGRIFDGDMSFYMLGTTPPTYDSFSTTYSLLMCPEEKVDGRWPTLAGQGSFNPGGYCNPEVDAALRQASVELDPAKRQALFSDAWRRMQEDVAYIPLHQQGLAWGVRAGVEVVQRPDNVFELRLVRLADDS